MRPGSGAAGDCYRLMALRLSTLFEPRAGGVLVVTSPGPGDGRTTTARGLGAGFAGTGRRALVVDADDPGPARGEAIDVLSVVRAQILPGAALLALARAPGPPSPHGRAGALCALMPALRAQHDVVIVDAPALAASVDSVELARAADGVVLVVRARSTRRDAVAMALDALGGGPAVRIVLNDYAGAAPVVLRRRDPTDPTDPPPGEEP